MLPQEIIRTVRDGRRVGATDIAAFVAGMVDGRVTEDFKLATATWVDVGSSYVPSELNAAFLLAQLERLEIVGSSGAGLVKVTVNGKNEMRRLEIDASLFKPEDKGVVEDLIVAAVNEAVRKVDDQLSGQLGGMTGGMKIPGLF